MWRRNSAKDKTGENDRSQLHRNSSGGLRRHCEPTGRRKAPPDDRLREAIQLCRRETESWIASSLALLAMTTNLYGQISPTQDI
jgi:hypothetical protein